LGRRHNGRMAADAAGSAEAWATVFEKRSAATSFDQQAAEYARLRPGYPPAALDAAVPDDARVVLDLAAGTGKLTGDLLERGLEVVAVEPLPGMLAELRRRFPAAGAICGTAENIPLADSTVDAVVVGQAFHWFDPDRALSEIARVLRPGGSLALLWNHDDESDPFVAEIYAAMTDAGRPPGGATRRSGGGTTVDGEPAPPIPPFQGHPALTDPQVVRIGWLRSQSVDDLIGLVNTYSYVIRATDETRATLAAAIRTIALRHAPGRQDLLIPGSCEVWRSTCR
jgi:ubiquinone/menaquinone biosynthesis C-methylase UbiE